MQRLGRVLLIVVVLGGAIWYLAAANHAYAKGWSWQSGQPTVKGIEPTDESNGGWCRGIKLSAAVDHHGTQEVCLTDELPTSGLRWGYYNDNGYQMALVSLAYEPKFHVVNGLGYDARITHYSAETDTMVIGYPIGALGKLRVYKNVLQRLTKNRLASGEVVFNFNGSNVDFGGSQAWYVGSVGLSNNGRYAAVELRDYGIALIDLSTYATKLITNQYIRYDYGADPYTEYAVSNNGGLVARAGMNVPLQLFTVDDECGSAIGTADNSPRVSITSCPTVNLPYEKFAPSPAAFYAPSFSDSGGLLRFFVRDRGLGGRFVTLAAAGFQDERLSYLALGDSYTSGEGETDDHFYAAETNTDHEKCHLSARSYPFIYGLQLGLPAGGVKSVACSGANSGDIIGSDDNYWGQSKRLGSGGLNLSDNERRARQAEALNDFTPGRVHQLSFVEKYNPQLITVGIGGNDSGLFGKLAACAMPGSCEWVTPKGKAQTYQEINNLEPKLTATYQKIKQASPGSQVYAVNYPEVIDLDGRCSDATAAVFNADERHLIVESVHRINSVIDAAAKKAGIKVLDIENSFDGHRLCDSNTQSAISNLRFGDDFGPANWLTLLGNETFHPTPYGHQLVAETIYRQLPQLKDDPSGCVVDCQTGGDANYWTADLTTDYPATHNVDLTTTTVVKSLEASLSVQLPAYSLMEQSMANIRVDDTTLVEVKANADGSLSADLSLPGNLDEGVHTIHVEGDSPSEDTIDDYQMINYQPPHVDEPADTISQPAGDDTRDRSTSESAIVAADNPWPGYNRFDSLLSWGWRLPIASIKSPSLITDSSVFKSLTDHRYRQASSINDSSADRAVLGWSDQRSTSWLAWLFGPMVWRTADRLASWGLPGIMSPWLIFVLW